jgi:ATP-dependent Lhr-like helicase
VLEHARRRALAHARQQITAVGLPELVAFLQRWQHLDPRDRLAGSEGVGAVIRQLAGIVRPAAAWERDYLPSRVRPYDATALTTLTQTGAIVWVADGGGADRSETRALTGLRFVERGTAARWLAPQDAAAAATAKEQPAPPTTLSDAASRTVDALRSYGASFVSDLQAATRLTTLALREALRELAAAGLVTNDSAEALREVIRFRPLLPGNRRDDQDPTRWLPADFSPSPGRPIVQRRPNLRRLPKWRRPDLPGGRDGWVGRWSLVRTPGIMGAVEDDETRAEAIARQWLDRYGIVTRDWWRRERPSVAWRLIYRELRRLELRGEVRRGYFVRGLAGAQFASAAAVDALRAAADAAAPAVTMSVSDPANAYALPLVVDESDRPPIARPRGRGALLVTKAGRVIMSAEGRGRRIAVAPGTSEDDVRAAAESLVAHLSLPSIGGVRRHDLEIEAIDGAAATRSPFAAAFVAVGFRRDGLTLRKALDFGV